MKKTFLFLIAFLLFQSSGYSKSPDSLYTFTAYGGAGYVRNIAQFDYEFPSLNKNGFLAGLRVMWKPDYLVRAGIEVGRTDLYSVDESSIPTDSGTTNLQTDVYSWNFMLVFSMSPMDNLEINVGTGMAFNTVNNTAFGNESTSTDGGSVFMISSGYYFPVSEDLMVGAELRWMHIPKYDDQTISLQLSIAYTFLEY
ncbi:MAG: hypothetical protein IH618_09555 [Ignavibacteriaceae bacterium]|nr:hypothetical protein [Ignavibacteriaceae bacterium]